MLNAKQIAEEAERELASMTEEERMELKKSVEQSVMETEIEIREAQESQRIPYDLIRDQIF